MKTNKNILITSAGKRVSLTKLFKQTVQQFCNETKIYTTDMCPALAPAGVVSDGCFKVPRATDKNYIDILLQLCIENHIKIIVPTIDTELLILAENKKLFLQNNIEILVSDTKFIEICRDKRKTNLLFQNLNINIPQIFDKNNLQYPLFAKPYDGSLSKDIYTVHNQAELTPEIVNNPKLIFMEYVDKEQYKEFTIDMYYGKDNLVKSIVPRERLEIRAGEINKGFTRKNELVAFLKERMNYLQGVAGCICVQLFYRKKDNHVLGIEINPRFGGGYPLSYYAKADFISYIVKEYILDEKIDYSCAWLDNTLMLRYDAEVIVYENEESCCF